MITDRQNRSLSWLTAGALLLALSGLPLSSAAAAPTLPGGVINDLRSTQDRLQGGEHAEVGRHSRAQAQRLAGGNASDRWARALYLQLAARAEARLGDAAAAADLLAQAREIRGIRSMDTAQVDRWQRQEAGLRRQVGDNLQARELLGDWLSRHAGSVDDRWLMSKLLADDEQWSAAGSWVQRALELDTMPDDTHSAFAAGVLQRAGDSRAALELIEARLEQAGNDAAEWRRAAGLAQQLGDSGRAAAIWESGWQLGVLAGSDDLEQRVRLHLAAGTPARAAELLEQALLDGALPESLFWQRLLAESWQAARDRDQALAAWQALAEQTGEADDWLALGQLASGWGQWEQARSALERARSLGSSDADDWLVNLPPVE